MERPVLICLDKGSGKTRMTLNSGKTEFYNGKPIQLLEQWCLENGSTLQGRTEAFKMLTHTVQKPAVLISERSQILYFPTLSSENPDCIWICYNEILQIHSSKDDTTQILFASSMKQTLKMNYRIIRNQMNRCRSYLDLINRNPSRAMIQTEAVNGIINAAGGK